MAFSSRYAARWVAPGLGAAFLATLVATLVLIALLYAMQSLPSAGILAHIRLSFTNGALQEHDWLLHNDRLGVNQYNDCLNRSTHRWHTLGSVRCAHGYVALSLFVRLAHATQGWPEICVYESLVV